MKSSRVFIKANYIKKAKDDWVYCEAHILTHDKLSILKLTSINLETKVNEIGTIKRCNSAINAMKVLLNLSEFKSSEIKPVNFRNTEKFAIKLIPSGILHNKKLLLVPEDEEDLTKWCSILSEYLLKSKEKERKNNIRNDEMTIKVDKDNSEKSEVVKKEESPVRKSNSSQEDNEEVYFAMDDNDVYDGNSLENSYTVCVEENSDSKKFGLQGSFILRLKEEGLELVTIKKGEIIHKFPYIFIRRFGSKNDILRLEAGRKCTTGEGHFMFRFTGAQKAVETIRQLVRELKASVSNTQTDSLSIDNSNRNSMSQSTVSGMNNDFVDSSTARSNSFNSPPSGSSASSMLLTPNNISPKQEFFSQESSTLTKTPPIVSPKPQHLMSPQNSTMSETKQIKHPLYSSINSGHNGRTSVAKINVMNNSRPTTINRPPSVVNNNFNRNNHAAASFSHHRPAQVQIPVTRISQDDMQYRTAPAKEVYDNLPVYGRPRDHQISNSSVRYSSNYSMPGPKFSNGDGNYDNVPNNQRCIRELETMLNDLGIPSH